MNTDNFREALIAKLESGAFKQAELARLSGVPQPTLCMFISGKRQDMMLGYALKLWNHVYGCEPVRESNG